MNSRCLTIRPMSHVSCTALGSLSNGLKKCWPGPTRHFSPNGSVTAIPTLKKSPKRKGGHSLRRRSQLPPGPHALPDLGAPGLAATNPHHRTEKHLEDIWHHRTVRRSVPLSLPDCFQRRDLHRISRKDAAQLWSPQNLSDPRQCVLPQGPHGVELVFRSSQTYGSLQPSRLFSTAQCAGTNRHHARLHGTHNRYFATQDELHSALTSTFRSIQRNSKQVQGYLRPYE